MGWTSTSDNAANQLKSRVYVFHQELRWTRPNLCGLVRTGEIAQMPSASGRPAARNISIGIGNVPMRILVS